MHIPALLHIFLPRSPLWLNSVNKSSTEIAKNYEKLTGKKFEDKIYLMKEIDQNNQKFDSNQSNLSLLEARDHPKGLF